MALVPSPTQPPASTPAPTTQTPHKKTKGEVIDDFCQKLLKKLDEKSIELAKSQAQEDKLKSMVYAHLKAQLSQVFSDQAVLTGFIVHVLLPYVKDRTVEKNGKKVTEKYLDNTKFKENQNKAIEDQLKEAIQKHPQLKNEVTKEKIEKTREEFAFINQYFEAIACTYLL